MILVKVLAPFFSWYKNHCNIVIFRMKNLMNQKSLKRRKREKPV
jgi:hypothetical protein